MKSPNSVSDFEGLDWLEFWLEIAGIGVWSMGQYGNGSREGLGESWVGGGGSCKYFFWARRCWVRAWALVRDFWL
jgi:hypothetical protein